MLACTFRMTTASESLTHTHPSCCPGLDLKAKAALWEGKYDFKRYGESGQIMIDKARHLGGW